MKMKKTTLVILILIGVLIVARIILFLIRPQLVHDVTPPGTAAISSTATSAGAASLSTSTAPVSVSTPTAGALVSSPLIIEGEARGNWYFEAQFPVELQDSHGNVIARGRAHAQGNWETSDFVPFRATLTFVAPTTPTGALILMNDNPSGDPARLQEILIDVRLK